MSLLSFLTGRTSSRHLEDGAGEAPSFSRACGAVVPIGAHGLPSPNSAAGERVRIFLEIRISGGGTLKGIAVGLGREPKRIYREAEGDAVLSWDLVDRAGSLLSLEDRLALGRFLMDRWGLRVEVGAVERLEV